jgi:hypothetical protein
VSKFLFPHPEQQLPSLQTNFRVRDDNFRILIYNFRPCKATSAPVKTTSTPKLTTSVPAKQLPFLQNHFRRLFFISAVFFSFPLSFFHFRCLFSISNVFFLFPLFSHPLTSSSAGEYFKSVRAHLLMRSLP